ncbi:MAG: bifunctional glutamate N-acetyltransferase/amino-acid acetyltransferase ArgJ [Deltaproteobacteria bacterium]|nr:bifunctional glutamate N-acetyltransferase/amino-acid acetyltransferase ArgJ [Deltaproteobacteria bacterium]
MGPVRNFKVAGFSASAVSGDIRKKGDGRLDMGLIFCSTDASAAGVFTGNSMAAAPVVLCRERLEIGTARAVLVNSGNANCMTGQAGMENARKLCRDVGRLLGISEESVLNSSTGVVGVPLPIKDMGAALDPLVMGLSEDGMEIFSRAILTSDTRSKTSAVDLDLSSGPVRVLGVAKGAGMIAPNMATMLAFILTDAAVPPGELHGTLYDAVEGSFNAVTVDGDTSTNDTVLMLASGMGPALGSDRDRHLFRDGVGEVCRALARQVVADGEGADRVVEVLVVGADDNSQAKLVARAVAQSLLVKTALAAADPNWGRIAVAVGYSGAGVHPEDLSLSIGDVAVLRGGEPVSGYREEDAAKIMVRDSYTIRISLGSGTGAASMLTTDLTEEYVRINCEYRS